MSKSRLACFRRSASNQQSLHRNLTAALMCSAINLAGIALVRAADQDWQSWNAASINHDINERWAVSFQAEARFSDDISELNEVVLKPAVYYKFSHQAKLGVGYKYIVKERASNEQDIWQEFYYSHPFKALELTHQFRLEERFLKHIDGIIPRFRYLIQATYPLDATRYLAVSEAVRFNLRDTGAGPVGGFEQNRLYFGMGHKWRKNARVEFGYLWRYEKKRNGEDRSDNVIRLQFHFDTKNTPPPHSGS